VLAVHFGGAYFPQKTWIGLAHRLFRMPLNFTNKLIEDKN
jgi:hypothetical protein